MKFAKAIAAIGFLAMTGILIYGFTVGNFNAEGNVLLAMPWGHVSLVDVYTGLMLFAGWVVYRERALFRSIVWIVLLIVLGNWTASLYVLIALQHSGSDWKKFWLGKNA